jgi:hypothetical protein
VHHRGTTFKLRHFLPFGRQDLHVAVAGAADSTLYRHIQLWSPTCTVVGGEEVIKMTTLLIVLVVLFLLGGGGWGYSRWRG